MQHPETYCLKEVDWFFEHSPKTKISQRAYEVLFPATYAVRGEIASHYDQHHYLGRIADVYPNIKLIYSLRDPVDRFVSEVRHLRAFPNYDEEFNDIDTMLADYWAGRHERWQIGTGFYRRTIRRITALGLSVHLINFDDLVHDQQTVWIA